MTADVETMAWTNELPWHGLGVKVEGQKTVDEWLHMAGLDWTVDLQKMQTVNGVEVPDHYALVRSTDSKVLTVTGNRWNPVQNSEAFKFFKSFAEAGGATMETAGSLKGGQIVWGLASLNDKFTVAGKTDVVKGYILLVSPHVLGRSIIAKVTSVRVVCSNTLAMATSGTGAIEKRFSHVGKFDPQVAADSLGLVREEFAAFGKLAEQLAKLNMSKREVLDVLGPIFNEQDPKVEEKVSPTLKSVLESYEKAPGAQVGTGWGVLSGVTYWADHVVGRNPDTRLDSAWLGFSASRKERTLKALAELV